MTTTLRTPARLLIVDDHPIVRLGIRQMVSTDPTLSICGETDSAASALQRVQELESVTPWGPWLRPSEDAGIRIAGQKSEAFGRAWKVIRDRLAPPGSPIELASRAEWAIRELEALEAHAGRDRPLAWIDDARDEHCRGPGSGLPAQRCWWAPTRRSG